MRQKIYAIREGVIAGLVVLFILEFLTYFIYLNAINAQKGEIFEGLLRTTRVIRTLIDVDHHSKLSDPAQEDSTIYQAQIAPLAQALHADKSIEFIYTMIQRDSIIYFILDATPDDLTDANGNQIKSHIMSIYEDPSQELERSFVTQKDIITENVYFDQWGGHISCFTPLFDRDKFIGILGVDISTETYHQRLYPIQKATQRTMVTIFFIAYLSGLIIWFLRHLQTRSNEKYLHS